MAAVDVELQSHSNNRRGYRRLSRAAFACLPAGKRDVILAPIADAVHISIGGWRSFYNTTIMCTYNALCTDDTDTPVSCDKRFRNFWGVCSNLSPISSNVSSVRTWSLRFTFLFFRKTLSLDIFLETLLEICVVFQNTTFYFSYTYCEYTRVHAMRIPV